MNNIGSWRFWLIIFLAIALAACAGRRERREEAKQERLERREQARAEREGRATPAAPATAPATAPAAPGAAPAPATMGDASAKVVFMRVGKMGGAISASVFDVTEPGEPKFIGIVRQSSKVAYPVKPGLYTFMVISEAADFMQAAVLGGKTYYALVTPRMGVWKARFSFQPVRGEEIGTKKFAGWERGTRLVTNTPDSLAWAKNNAADIADKRTRYWPEWSSKSEKDRAAQTLNADDGR